MVARYGTRKLCTPIAVVNAPIARNAPCPSEIWPENPVSTFRPRMAIAKISAYATSSVWKPLAMKGTPSATSAMATSTILARTADLIR